MDNALKQFEENYWSKTEQKEVFRHTQALGWLDAASVPVLDVGCGDGFFLEKLRSKGIEAWGVDISQIAVDKCRTAGLAAETCDFAAGQIPEKRTKTAVVLDVLEHLYDPLPLLKALRQKADVLIISVPNFSSLPARLQALVGKVPENNSPRKGHVYWYTAEVLRKRLDEAGWKITTWGTNPPWASKFLIGPLLRRLANRWPGFWSLSFVVKCERV